MTTKDEALKLALEALDCIYSPLHVREINKVGAAMTAIKEALAQPEQHQDWCASLTQMLASMPPQPAPCNCKPEPVIDKSAAERIATALGWEPKRKPLTDEEIILIVADCASSHQHTDIHFARAIEAAHGIKEKNT